MFTVDVFGRGKNKDLPFAKPFDQVAGASGVNFETSSFGLGPFVCAARQMNDHIVIRQRAKMFRIGQIVTAATREIVGVKIAANMSAKVAAAACNHYSLVQLDL